MPTRLVVELLITNGRADVQLITLNVCRPLSARWRGVVRRTVRGRCRHFNRYTHTTEDSYVGLKERTGRLLGIV